MKFIPLKDKMINVNSIVLIEKCTEYHDVKDEPEQVVIHCISVTVSGYARDDDFVFSYGTEAIRDDAYNFIARQLTRVQD